MQKLHSTIKNKIRCSLKHVSIICLIFSLFLLSCCVSANKRQEMQHEDEETEQPTDIGNPVAPISVDEMKVNAVYREMLEKIKTKDESFSSLDVPWLKTLEDDGKYFYSVGVSEWCLSRKDAKRFAQNDAKENLRDAVSGILGTEIKKTPGWELIETRFYEITKEGEKYYTAAVLIGADRNLVVKSE